MAELDPKANLAPMTMDPKHPDRVHAGRVEQRIAAMEKERRPYLEGTFTWDVKTEGIVLLRELLALRAALSRPKAAEPLRDDALLPNDVLDDNYARALAADGASGNMSMDTTLAITLIDEVRRSRAAPSATPQMEPVAWRAPVNPFGQPGWSYAETEQSLIDFGHHDRQPLYAAPHQPDTGMVMIGVSDEVVKLVHDAFREGMERADKPWSPQATAWDQSRARVRLNAMISAASPLHATPPIEPERQR